VLVNLVLIDVKHTLVGLSVYRRSLENHSFLFFREDLLFLAYECVALG